MRRSKVCLYLTSFGPFLDVAVNPSEEIGRLVSEELRAEKSPVIAVVSHVTLEVSVEAVHRYFSETLPSLLLHGASGLCDEEVDVMHLHLHLGVCRGAAGRIQIEHRAFNELHCPQGDVAGVVRLHEPILPKRLAGLETSEADSEALDVLWSAGLPNVECSAEEGTLLSIGANVSSDMIAQAIVAANSDSPNHLIACDETATRLSGELCRSDDPGRYLCNYCYFSSLVASTVRNCDELDHHRHASLFVHVLDPSKELGQLRTADLPSNLVPQGANVFNPSSVMQASLIVKFLTALSDHL